MTYDGAHFQPQPILTRGLLYSGINLGCIAAMKGFFMLIANFDSMGGRHTNLFKLVMHGSQLLGLGNNFLTLYLIIRNRRLLIRCMTGLQRLWRM